MAGPDDFAAKLTLVLKALSISRARLAADAGVDKSLVGRWCAGTYAPAAHNLERITQSIAERHPGFTMVEWDRSIESLAAGFGIVMEAPEQSAGGTPSAIAGWLAQTKVREAVAATRPVGASIAGFWRSTRPSPEYPGRLIHDHLLIAPTTDGPLSYRVGVMWTRFSGWAIVSGDQLYTCATGNAIGTTMFSIFNRVRSDRVDAMDGVVIATMADGGGVPCALACYIERVGELSGDADADEARYESMLARHPLAPEGSVPTALERHLLRDTGPAAMVNGGDPIIMMRAMTSISRGSEHAAAALRLVAG